MLRSLRSSQFLLVILSSACVSAHRGASREYTGGLPGVEYRLAVSLTGETFDSMILQATVINHTSDTVRIPVGPCMLSAELFVSARSGASVWSTENQPDHGNVGIGRTCTTPLNYLVLAKGDSSSPPAFRYSVLVNEMLADSIPDGRYLLYAKLKQHRSDDSIHFAPRPISLRRRNQPAGLWDAHTHLSLAAPKALQALTANGIVAVRDMGANNLEDILKWRDEINAGKLAGPRIYTAGVILDGPKPDSSTRWIIRTEAEAVHAVDSLAKRKVDFIKTHNGLSRPVYFAILREARKQHLKVASHLAVGVPAWEAADSGAASIEHAAESMVASPIYAGFAKSPQEAIEWWNSPAGDSAIAQLKKSGVYFTPTLALYEANINGAGARVGTERSKLFRSLLQLTSRMYHAGIPIMAGSDIGVPRGDYYQPGRALLYEIMWLRWAGLSEEDLKKAAAGNIAEWLGVTNASSPILPPP